LSVSDGLEALNRIDADPPGFMRKPIALEQMLGTIDVAMHLRRR
jgi:hypothetical protein